MGCHLYHMGCDIYHMGCHIYHMGCHIYMGWAQIYVTSHVIFGLGPYDICDIPCDIRIPIDLELHMHHTNVLMAAAMSHDVPDVLQCVLQFVLQCVCVAVCVAVSVCTVCVVAAMPHDAPGVCVWLCYIYMYTYNRYVCMMHMY